MTVQDTRLSEASEACEVPEVSVKGEVRRESSGMTMASAPRPAAVDAVRWANTLLTQLGLDPHASKGQRRAA